MQPRQLLKKGLMILAAITIIFLIYSLTPRISHSRTSYAVALDKSAELPQPFKKELRAFIRDTASRMQNVIIVHQGKTIFEEGSTSKLINCHSARKSVMSLLIGIAQDKGLLQLDESLAELGINESKTPLTTTEKSATIRDLLMCTSGIFLKAEAEHDWADDIRPKRNQYQPGDFFFYNNWDFNVLGTILERKTGMSIGEFMQQHLAKPLGMEEFSAKNIVYNSPWPVPSKTNSDFPVFWMYLSARDMAKVGVLVAQNGKWNGQQIVSTEWLKESLQPYSKLDGTKGLYDPFEAFTYSWWLESDTKTIWADGFGGQFMCIDPERELVVIQRNFTGNSLLTSGLWLMDKERDNNPKHELLYVYEKVIKQLAIR